ncbi:DUF2515 family protein [Bacillus sp. FSL K6-3431]|uniref:DUF2515 family protein n=1 Tax=Bacillus sp. FSL K6-3431 TaxID=2921500 RepID=UPI0030F55928
MFLLKKLCKNLRLPADLQAIKSELKKKQHISSHEQVVLSKEDKELLQQIKKTTIQSNTNNVTRTEAYLYFYLQYPEIHWAFLGHMVSRNGGWNMTDLKGEHLSRLMTNKTRVAFFSFLERGNWLIFQDVYPQFLLYSECKKKRRNLFYLLPFLNVSVFMEVIWNQFWKKQNCYYLAIALVINEQSYLEKRIVQNPLYKKEVFQTLEFILQDILSFNHILFPYEASGRSPLIGLTLHQFGSVHERISLGKKLYHLLFHSSERYEKVLHWAITHPHTGSRKDYWPAIFNNVNEGVPGKGLNRRLIGCQLQKGANKLYSPRLEHAWKNIDQAIAEPGDWFNDSGIVIYLEEETVALKGDIMEEYCETLENLELVAMAKKAIST